MTTHFKISCVFLMLLGIGLLITYNRIATRVGDVTPSPNVLPKQDKERITFNEKTHTLTIQTATKTIKEYAKNPIIVITKSGVVQVARHLSGFENEPFIGFGYSDTGRVFIGDNLLHFSRFDLAGSISYAPDNRHVAFKPYLGVGYNVYSNTSINLAVNPVAIATRTPDIAGFVSVRF